MFYRLYFIIEKRSREQFNLLILLCFNFNKLGNLNKAHGLRPTEEDDVDAVH